MNSNISDLLESPNKFLVFSTENSMKFVSALTDAIRDIPREVYCEFRASQMLESDVDYRLGHPIQNDEVIIILEFDRASESVQELLLNRFLTNSHKNLVDKVYRVIFVGAPGECLDALAAKLGTTVHESYYWFRMAAK